MLKGPLGKNNVNLLDFVQEIGRKEIVCEGGIENEAGQVVHGPIHLVLDVFGLGCEVHSKNYSKSTKSYIHKIGNVGYMKHCPLDCEKVSRSAGASILLMFSAAFASTVIYGDL